SYYSAHYSTSCPAQLGLFGLSAGESPAPAMVARADIYQASGLGGAIAPANDGSALGAPVVVPHYSAMVASLRSEESIKMWDWLIDNGYFSPLNNVESLLFQANGNCYPTTVVWNQLKGSWNLSLQTLGWGRYLMERDGQDSTLWQAAKTTTLLHNGYLLLESGGSVSNQSPTPTPGNF
ncbi:MAG TPA: hypothetical protein VI547_01530, partial [Anaerolineales bacterium]|nr:hypothetical protein [Anaerolineales bacterium]